MFFRNRASGFFRTNVFGGGVSAHKFFGNWPPTDGSTIQNDRGKACCPVINNGCCEPTPLARSIHGNLLPNRSRL